MRIRRVRVSGVVAVLWLFVERGGGARGLCARLGAQDSLRHVAALERRAAPAGVELPLPRRLGALRGALQREAHGVVAQLHPPHVRPKRLRKEERPAPDPAAAVEHRRPLLQLEAAREALERRLPCCAAAPARERGPQRVRKHALQRPNRTPNANAQMMIHAGRAFLSTAPSSRLQLR